MNTEQIISAAAVVRKIRPSYTDLLDFYEPIFKAQEKSASDIHLRPVTISPETLSVKIREQAVFMTVSDFAVDPDSAKALFSDICRIASKTETNPVLSDSGSLLLKTVEAGDLDAAEISSQLLKDNDGYFQQISEKYKIYAPLLYFAAYHSIKPSVTVYAKSVSERPEAHREWQKGCCPVCGSLPCLSSLEKEGFRYLFCSFCWHCWNIGRVFCPFCGNQDQRAHYYIYNDEEKEYRIDVCDHCKKYIKTVDTRHLDRPFYPPLEQIVTLHLDIAAGEEGLETGKQTPWQI